MKQGARAVTAGKGDEKLVCMMLIIINIMFIL
jgi:hypothetical protein